MKLREVRKAQWTVLAVCSERGDCELLEFFAELMRTPTQPLPMLHLLERISVDGPRQLSDLVSHQIDGPIWEFIRGDLRVLWFYDAEKVVICSHGFVKKRQKTPKSEIEKAKAAHARYNADKALQKNRIINDN